MPKNFSRLIQNFANVEDPWVYLWPRVYILACIHLWVVKARWHNSVVFYYETSTSGAETRHSWAQWPLASQNTQNGSSLRLSFRPDHGCLELTWRAAADGVYVRVSVDSPRIFCAMSAPSTSSLRNSISFEILPSESPCRSTRTIHRRQDSGGKERSILGANTLP